MTQKPSKQITDVIRFIAEFDKSIFYNSSKFQGYIRDYYNGNRFVADDFIEMLTSLSNKIESSKINPQDIVNLRLQGSNSTERSKIHIELLKTIYIKEDINQLKNIELCLAKIYAEYVEHDAHIENDISKSLIISFGGNDEHLVEYGEQIKFVWKCKNPHRICLSNGHTSMDVTHLDSIILSAMFDYYELILYDDKGKITDKKTIKIQYKKNVYCINCGHPYFDANTDNYCTNCGMIVFHGN